MRRIRDFRFAIGDFRSTQVLTLFATALVLYGCGGEYAIRTSDDKSAANGPLFFFGWADPPLIPGTRLADAPHGSRVVLWNHELGFEAIVDIGETCAVLAPEDLGARAPTERELAAVAAVFPAWPVVASTQAAHYANERRLERRFWSHIFGHLEGLDSAAAAEFALGDAPAGWLNQGGREWALVHVATKAPLKAVTRMIDRTKGMSRADRTLILVSILERRDLTPELLTSIAIAGAPIPAARHPGADEAVCLTAIDEIAKEPLSSDRRDGLAAVLESPGATDRVRDRVLEVPLAYPEDREAVRRAAEGR